MQGRWPCSAEATAGALALEAESRCVPGAKVKRIVCMQRMFLDTLHSNTHACKQHGVLQTTPYPTTGAYIPHHALYACPYIPHHAPNSCPYISTTTRARAHIYLTTSRARAHTYPTTTRAHVHTYSTMARIRAHTYRTTSRARVHTYPTTPRTRALSRRRRSKPLPRGRQQCEGQTFGRAVGSLPKPILPPLRG